MALPELSLSDARNVLAKVVATSEKTINIPPDILRIGGVAPEVLRGALAVVGLDICDFFAERLNRQEFSKLNEKNIYHRGIGLAQALKQTPEGLLRFSLYREGHVREGTNELIMSPSRVTMSVMRNFDPRHDWGYMLEAEVPLKDDIYDQPFQSLGDFVRTEKPEGRRQMEPARVSAPTPQLAKIRTMVRGLRWMSANMLDWEKPGVIMPLQLDRESLPFKASIKIIT